MLPSWVGRVLGPGRPEVGCDAVASPCSTGYVELPKLTGEDAEASCPGMEAHFFGCPALRRRELLLRVCSADRRARRLVRPRRVRLHECGPRIRLGRQIGCLAAGAWLWRLRANGAERARALAELHVLLLGRLGSRFRAGRGRSGARASKTSRIRRRPTTRSSPSSDAWTTTAAEPVHDGVEVRLLRGLRCRSQTQLVWREVPVEAEGWEALGRGAGARRRDRAGGAAGCAEERRGRGAHAASAQRVRGAGAERGAGRRARRAARNDARRALQDTARRARPSAQGARCRRPRAVSSTERAARPAGQGPRRWLRSGRNLAGNCSMIPSAACRPASDLARTWS